MRTVINISFPASLARQLQKEVKQGNYASTSEFFRMLLRKHREAKELYTQVMQSEEDFRQGNYKTLHSLKDADRDIESKMWMDAQFTDNLPPYDWGKKKNPSIKPVRYEAGKGFVVEE